MAFRETAGTSELASPAPSVPIRSFPRHVSAPSPNAVSVERFDNQPPDHLLIEVLKGAPAWLISAIVHMIALIVLALFLVPQLLESRVELQATFADTLGEQLVVESDFATPLMHTAEEPVLTPNDLLAVLEPIAEPSDLLADMPGFDFSSDPVLGMVGIAYEGRQAGSKESLLGAYGGTALTQQAVLAGLEWLARNQQKDGSWSLVGPYANGARSENREVATAMALLAFQGDGNTTEYGEYKDVVERGWYYLLRKQDDKGCFYRERHRIHRFYSQGIATIAICELYAMTSDPALKQTYREPAVKAIEYCVETQSPEGGWRYVPHQAGDLSVTGWILMALQSARMAGLDVPLNTLDRASAFLDSVAKEDGSRYCYHPGRAPTTAMTAEGLLCRQYLGWKRDDPNLVNGVEWLLQRRNQINYKRERDVYYWYYATQVMHHMEGEAWRKWNERMCQTVPQAQVGKGIEAGSWDPLKPARDRRAEEGGRLYVTCLSLYMLQVYYRHLPLYANPYTHLK